MKGIFQYRKAASKSRRSKATLRLWQVWPLWLIIGAFLVLGVAALITPNRGGRPQQDDVSESRLLPTQELRLALDKLEAGRLYLFSYAAEQGRRIRFLVERGSDGAVHSTLASCKACYHTERPHYTRKGQLMCGMCNHAMHQPDEQGLTLEQKRCALVAVPHSIKGNQVVVAARDVLDQARAVDGK